MPPDSTIEDTTQTRTLRAFTILHHLGQDWRGSLILALGLNPNGTALSLAANIAGAVCLSIEEDSATARVALRSGACDFVVNTVDEALRALKNEIRKHHPLSVGLHGNQAEILRELLDRGVAPQLVADLTGGTSSYPALRMLQSRGSKVLAFGALPPIPDVLAADQLLDAFLNVRQWTACIFSLPDPASLRSFDTTAVALLPEDDHLRRTWLTSAPRLFPRERPPRRVLWLSESEKTSLQKMSPPDVARR